MKTYLCKITLTKLYYLSVEAFSEEAAYKKADALSTLEIAEQGSLKDVTVESIEVEEQELSLL